MNKALFLLIFLWGYSYGGYVPHHLVPDFENTSQLKSIDIINFDEFPGAIVKIVFNSSFSPGDMDKVLPSLVPDIKDFLINKCEFTEKKYDKSLIYLKNLLPIKKGNLECKFITIYEGKAHAYFYNVFNSSVCECTYDPPTRSFIDLNYQKAKRHYPQYFN